MSKFKYPVDTDQFQIIREQGRVYVDKTDLMYNLVSNYNYVFLARPRRFGKSLLCTTLKAYFQGQKELFEGLKVMEFEKEWKTYPVLHFDMSIMRNCSSLDGCKEALSAMLSSYESLYGATKQADEFGTRFHQLIQHIYDTLNKQVVVIIDEYDTPMMRNLYNNELLEVLRNMLRGFYQTVKLDGAYLRFVFITGVTKFSQLSIFSELNNLKQISMLETYSGLCGITQNELSTVLRPCVEEYAENLNISVDEAYSLLKKNYDGYHFSPNGQDVYAPYSLFNAFSDHSTCHFWFESGTSASLLEHLRHYPNIDALEYDGMTVGLNEFSIPCEDADTPLPLLYQSGYLTIASYDPRLRSYVLKIPNNEVRKGLVDCLMPIVMNRTVADNNSLVRNMAAAIFDGDLNQALTALRSYIAKIPYDIITKEEWDDKERRESFYKMLIYMVFSLLNDIVDTEVKSILGCADVVIQTTDNVFVLELKVDGSVDEALAQIDNKGYAIPYEADGRKVIKCGVNISSEARNITQWRIIDADGSMFDYR